jgi:hypothetical protein
MNEQENTQTIQPEVEELEVEVVDQVDEQTGQAVSSDDELENYTKGVSKRINKLNERNRMAEEKAARLEQMLAQKEMETASMYQVQQQTRDQLLAKEEEALEAKQSQADDLYKKAIQAGDAELISKADTLKSDLSIQKEKLKVAKQQVQQQNFQNPQVVQQPMQQSVQQYQETPPATKEAKAWHEKNSWYGDQSDPDNWQASQFAYFTHYNLINEGYEADSDEYYEQLNNRVAKVYPDLVSGQSVEQSEGRPAVQRVASTSVGGRQKTQGKKNGVTFSKTEVERLRGLKPHNMSEDAWLKSVAKEKLKIANREAK